jgi:hypothetical protein
MTDFCVCILRASRRDDGVVRHCVTSNQWWKEPSTVSNS